MAALPDQERAGASGDWQADMSRRHENCSINRPALRAAVDAMDTWLDSNAAALNAAIPQPARANLTTSQKALMLTLVIQRRYLTGAGG